VELRVKVQSVKPCGRVKSQRLGQGSKDAGKAAEMWVRREDVSL